MAKTKKKRSVQAGRAAHILKAVRDIYPEATSFSIVVFMPSGFTSLHLAAAAELAMASLVTGKAAMRMLEAGSTQTPLESVE